MSEHGGVGEVVDSDNVISLCSEHLTESQTTDAAETVDCNFYRHVFFLQFIDIYFGTCFTEPVFELRRPNIYFIPKDGYVFVDADYSQIELRILAHISNDKLLISAFEQDIDIHTKTASEVFGVDIDKVTPLQRRRAKAVNFGIVYGMSDYGLSQDIKVSRKEAAQYIENYFAKFTGVKKYLDDIKEFAKENGYVTTIDGRIRDIPEINNSNHQIREFGKRVAMNSPIQGSAADIMKKAMILVYKRLLKECKDSKIVLQIHDELLVEAKDSEKDLVCKIIREEMEKAADLRVKLKVDVNTGSNWLEAH